MHNELAERKENLKVIKKNIPITVSVFVSLLNCLNSNFAMYAYIT